jgi:hypothetical protein
MCNNCKLYKALIKLLDKHNMWTSYWSNAMSDEEIWFCEKNASGICPQLEERLEDSEDD